MCEAHINDVLRKIKGVKKATSSHAKRASEVIAEDDVDPNLLAEAIKGQGYDVKGFASEPYVKKGLFHR